ncbi:MAG: hypothetical protein M0Z53_01865 [Thermaerobacter sp.]|nr:hypothetical protein [Thermaerobacter sp.]
MPVIPSVIVAHPGGLMNTTAWCHPYKLTYTPSGQFVAASSQVTSVSFTVPAGSVLAGTSHGLYLLSAGTNWQWAAYSALAGQTVSDVALDTRTQTVWAIANGNLYEAPFASSLTAPWTQVIDGATWNNLSGEVPGANYGNAVQRIAYNAASNTLWMGYGSWTESGLFVLPAGTATWQTVTDVNYPPVTPFVADPHTGGVDYGQAFSGGQGGGVLVCTPSGCTDQNGYDGFPSVMAVGGLGTNPAGALYASACELGSCTNTGGNQAGIYDEPYSTANSWAFVAAGIYPSIFRYDPVTGREYGLASNGLYVDNGVWSFLASVPGDGPALAYAPPFKTSWRAPLTASSG